MTLFLIMLGCWVLAIQAILRLYKIWRQQLYLQPARKLKEIEMVDYYRRLLPAQFESLMMQGLLAHKYTLLGDPVMERGREQGYAWKKGKRSVLVYRPERPLSIPELDEVAKRSRTLRAEQAIVFSPFSETPKTHRDGVTVLAGKKMLNWFSVLDIAPPVAVKGRSEKCECGANMKERVSRAGLPLLICSMYPDCRSKRQREEAGGTQSESGAGRRPITTSATAGAQEFSAASAKKDFQPSARSVKQPSREIRSGGQNETGWSSANAAAVQN